MEILKNFSRKYVVRLVMVIVMLMIASIYLNSGATQCQIIRLLLSLITIYVGAEILIFGSTKESKSSADEFIENYFGKEFAERLNLLALIIAIVIVYYFVNYLSNLLCEILPDFI